MQDVDAQDAQVLHLAVVVRVVQANVQELLEAQKELIENTNKQIEAEQKEQTLLESNLKRSAEIEAAQHKKPDLGEVSPNAPKL